MNQVVGGKVFIFSCNFLLLHKKGNFTDISGQMITMQVHRQLRRLMQVLCNSFNVSK